MGILFFVGGLSAQVGGLFTYEFLNFAPSARISALGGTHIAAVDDDINIAANNPGVLNPLMHEKLSFSHAFHPADIHYGYVTGGYHHKPLRTTFQLGVRYVNYGELDLTNVLGQVEGTFRAAEYGLTLGAGRQLNERFRAGANLRLISSQFETYNSLGLTADLGLVYQDTASNFTFTVLARNMGVQLSTYQAGNREPLPFEMQAGMAKRLAYLPFQFSIIYRFV
ncbi:MAG: hypothetical protein D6772_01225, partial [Bacteroidetes bacterium]